MTKQITNGGFQNPTGGLLTGNLLLVLSQDAKVAANPNQVAPIATRIAIAAGNIASTLIYFNDELLPGNTFYTMTAYDAAGNKTYGPEQVSFAGVGPLDLGTLVPLLISPDPLFSNPVLQNPAIAQTITGQALTLTTSAPLSVASINNVQYADKQAGATADVQIANAIAALPASGGFVDARGFGATTQTIAATVTLGAANKTVTLFIDRTTKFQCTITNNTPCWHVVGGSTIMAFGMVAYPNAGFTLASTASVSNVLLVDNDTGTNQVGNFIEGLTVTATSGATVSDAICANKDTLQLAQWMNTTCSSQGATNVVVMKVYTSASGKLMTNPIFHNLQIDGQGGTGNVPLWIGAAAAGSLTPINLGAGSMYAINFIGGLAVHPGSGKPIVQVEASNGAAGTNLIGNINFEGFQIESSNASDVGFLINGVGDGLTIKSLTATCFVNCGTDIIKLAQPAGTALDGINLIGVTNQGGWTGNIVNNTVNSLSVATGATGCTNGCNYFYGKSGQAQQSVWANALQNLSFNGSAGFTVPSVLTAGNMELFNASNTITSAPPAAAAAVTGWKSCLFSNIYCTGLASATEYHLLPNWFSVGSGNPANGGTATTPDASAATSMGNNGLVWKEIAAPTTAGAGFDHIYADSTSHTLKSSLNGGTFLNIPQVIGSGTAAMTTAAITAGNCGTTVTVGATGVLATDTIEWAFNAAPAGSNAGIVAWPTAANVNFAYCPGIAETPAAATINWRVVR